MYKLVVIAAVLAVCSAAVLLPTALHYVPHSSSRVTKVEWERPGLRYVVPAVAPVAPLVTYHHAAVIRPVLHHAPLLHAPLLHSPLVALKEVEKKETKKE